MPHDNATLEECFAYYTECALASVEDLELLKSASKSRVERARSIAEGMVKTCVSFKIEPCRRGRPCGRLRDAIQAAISEGVRPR